VKTGFTVSCSASVVMAVVLYSLQEIEEERKGYRKARKLF
jgi:hypothetical protein